METRIRKVVAAVSVFAIFVGCWKLITSLFDISDIILPPPEMVLLAAWEQKGWLLENGVYTFLEAIGGFLLALVSAIGLAILFEMIPVTKTGIYPYAVAVKAIPIIALAPIIVFWFGTGYWSKVVLAAIISFFPILVSAVDAFSSTKREAVDLMRSFSASRWEILLKLKLPSSLPSIFSGMKVASTLAVVGAVVAEFVNAGRGIGHVIKTTMYYGDTDKNFAAVLVAGAIGIALFWIVVALEKMAVHWHIRTIEQ